MVVLEKVRPSAMEHEGGDPLGRLRLGVIALASLIVGLPSLADAAESQREPNRPNVVFILADDLGSGDLGCYNAESKIPTPNMDRLANQGMRFTDAHSPSSVCTPTRYGIMTGRYAWRSRLKSGVLWGESKLLIEPGRQTVASMLKKYGYRTAGFGKWHLGFQEYDPQLGEKEQKVDYSKPLRPGPLTVGFDTYFGIPASLDMEPYVFVRDDGVLEQPTKWVEKSLHRRQQGGGFWRAGPIAPSFRHVDVLPAIENEAIKWLEQQSAETPFFCYIPLSAPHTPWLPTDEFRGKSKAGYYGDFVAQVDATIGNIVQTLERSGLMKNTLLIVTSDNGSHWPVEDIAKWGHASNLAWRGQKSDIWEGGHRVPFIACWPGKIQPGSVCAQTICLTDFMATAAGLVGHQLQDNEAEDSVSLLPLLLQQTTEPVREATVHHSGQGTFAIRRGDWKLILDNLGSGGFTPPRQVPPGPGKPAGQLYNLASDPAESQNVYQDHPQLVSELRQLLQTYIEQGRSRR